jgi:hypothetical protein
MAPDGSGLLTLDAPSVQTAPDGSRPIVWMIKWMIKAHPTENRMPGKQRPSLALAAHSIAVAVEPVRVGWPDREVAAADVSAVQVWRRRWDAEVGIGRVTVLRRRLGGRRPWPASRGRRGPGSPRRGRRRSNGRGGCRLQRPVVAGHDAFALSPLRLVGDLLALRRPHRTLRHLGDRPDLWLGFWLARPSERDTEQEGSQRHGPPPALVPRQPTSLWRSSWRRCAPAGRRLRLLAHGVAPL